MMIMKDIDGQILSNQVLRYDSGNTQCVFYIENVASQTVFNVYMNEVTQWGSYQAINGSVSTIINVHAFKF